MGIDINYEELLRLADVPKLKFMPPSKNGKRIHLATVYRWAMGGTGGVKLETLKVDGSLCTSTEALQRFFNALSSNKNYTGSTACSSHATTHDLDARMDRLIYGERGKPRPIDSQTAKAMEDARLAQMSRRHRRRYLEAERQLREAGL